MVTALEKYVQDSGIWNARLKMANRIRNEDDLNMKEFFIKCKKFLDNDQSGKIGEADKLYRLAQKHQLNNA